MKSCWIIADDFADTHIDPDQLKNIGPLWGSWKTWRAWQTDNVLCHDANKAQELVTREFQKTCNFHIPQKHYTMLGRPNNVNLYEGDFPGEFDNPEEIVAMHLASQNNNLILLIGYDLTEIKSGSKFQKHKDKNYINAFRATINTYPDVQWVLIDHSEDLDKSLLNLPNLTCDKFESVLQLLG